jgi:AbrB family looped-hinge helix DNA binding protein
MAATAPALPVKSQIAKVTSKGQITIPLEVRQALGVKPGDKLIFERSSDGELLIRKVDEFPFDRFRGMGTGIPEIEANPDSIVQYIRELRGHDEFDHLD